VTSHVTLWRYSYTGRLWLPGCPQKSLDGMTRGVKQPVEPRNRSARYRSSSELARDGRPSLHSGPTGLDCAVLLEAATGNEMSQGSTSITTPFKQSATVLVSIGQSLVGFERAIVPR
jgi:hypothetical protein